MGIWKQVKSQVTDIFKQTGKQVATEPLELGQSVVNQVLGQDAGTSEAGQSNQPIPSDPTIANDNNLLSSPNHLARYEELSNRKDEIELRAIRNQLAGQWGLDTSVDGGMQKARMEREQKEKQTEQVEEQKKEEKKWIETKKKEEDNVAVMAAKAQASGEIKAWGAG